MGETLEHVVKEAVKKGLAAASVGCPEVGRHGVSVSAGSSTSALAEAPLAQEIELSRTSEATEVNYVRSLIGVFHKVPKHGSVGAVGSWTTSCGWRFAAAGGGAEVVEALPSPLHYKFMCGKCFKPERHAAKSSL